MTLHISREQARRLLALYHFTPTDLPGVFERLGTVQYDPLNPVGRNPDLVLQARIAGYRVDDWQKAAYTDRLIYDAYDKQASQITVKDGHAIFWRSVIDKRVKSTEQAPGIAQDTPGRTDLDWATLLDRHRLTDRGLHARFKAHAVGAQIVDEVFGGYMQRV